MGRHEVPKRRSPTGGFTLTELLGVLAILALLVAVLFPVFQRIRPLPDGAVQDGSGKSLPGAMLRFRDPAGHVVATITADKNGDFRRDGLDSLSRNAVDGFGMSFSTHRTGSSDLYIFTPLGTHVATFRDEAGKPIPRLAVSFGPDHRTWQLKGYREPFEQVSDNSGTIQINKTPIGRRFEFQSRNPGYIVKRFQATVDGNTIRYAVTVTTPGTITGCLRDGNGRPLRGYKAFATVSPDLNHFDRWYADYLVTGPTGRFRITNLRPRVYYVSVAPARGYHALVPARRITLAPGQTAEVSLRADVLDQTPNAY